MMLFPFFQRLLESLELFGIRVYWLARQHFNPVGSVRCREHKGVVRKPAVKLPVGEDGRDLWLRRLFFVGDDQLSRQGSTVSNPELPIHGVRAEGDVPAWRSEHVNFAKISAALGSLHGALVRIAHQEVFQRKVDAILVAGGVQYLVNVIRNLNGSVKVVHPIEQGEGFAIIPETAAARRRANFNLHTVGPPESNIDSLGGGDFVARDHVVFPNLSFERKRFGLGQFGTALTEQAVGLGMYWILRGQRRSG